MQCGFIFFIRNGLIPLFGWSVLLISEKQAKDDLYHAENIYVCKHKVAKPRVFIPVFPGTNCEYDSTRAFERAGAEVDVKVFKNLTAEDIRDSVEVFTKAIDQSQHLSF